MQADDYDTPKFVEVQLLCVTQTTAISNLNHSQTTLKYSIKSTKINFFINSRKRGSTHALTREHSKACQHKTNWLSEQPTCVAKPLVT